MKKNVFFLILLCKLFFIKAQENLPPSYEIYQSVPEQIHNLKHTKLKVRFDFEKKQLIGEEWITLEPHFYQSDLLKLNAKFMDIYEVKLISESKQEKPLKYQYKDKKILLIYLGKKYKKKERYTIYISYRAKPEEIKNEGNNATRDSKGLYFIDSKENPKVVDQIWTQGEPDNNSSWFPTIDHPNQKTTGEIYITIPDEFVSLSNGLLRSQTKNFDGTRTDHWKMDLPHAPYLFFMGIGKYEIIRDNWGDVPLHYYLEKEYAPYAKQIFGNTAEMLSFFSKITGIKYPWPSYNQIVVRNFVSGAMENTTSVSFGEFAYQTPGELIDDNIAERVIAHEAFHHWFGDLVTMKSFSHLTLQESFANYSEYLWNEYKYGEEVAESKRIEDKYAYLNENESSKNLVRFYYKEKNELFDGVSYNKGAAILHMLRKFIGDDAFFKSMHEYLNTHKFSTAETHNWRMSVEKVTGRDLNWFFDQWYYSNGYPSLIISHNYNQITKKIYLKITQSQKEPLFEFPYCIDIYEKNGKKKSFNIWVKKQRENNFEFDFKFKPSLINIDPEGIIVSEVKEEKKSLGNYLFQYKHAKAYYSRYKAIEEVIYYLIDSKENSTPKNKIDNKDELALKIISKALSDPSNSIKKMALESIVLNAEIFKKTLPLIEKIARDSSSTNTQSLAISLLSDLKNKRHQSIFEKGLQSKSYKVIRSSLKGLGEIFPKKAAIFYKEILKKNPQALKKLDSNLLKFAISNKNLQKVDDIALFIGSGILIFQLAEKKSEKLSKKLEVYKEGFDWLISLNNFPLTQLLIDRMLLYQKIPYPLTFDQQDKIEYKKNPDLFITNQSIKIKSILKNLLEEALQAKKKLGELDQINYINKALEKLHY